MSENYAPFENEFDNQGDEADRTLKSLPVPDAPEIRFPNGLSNSSATVPGISKVNGSAAIETATHHTVYVSRSTLTASPPPPPSLMRESAVRERVRRRHTSGRTSGGEWAIVVIAAGMLGIVLLLGLVLMVIVPSLNQEQEVLPTAGFDLSGLPTAVVLRSDQNEFVTGQQVTLENGYTFILEPWDGESRFTMLLMGIDRRPGDRGLAHRTDTMIVLSIDPTSQSIGMLSIPRDLFVSIPGYSQRQRVNTAMALGEGNRSGYGPELAMRTIEYNLGIRIHDYAVVDFNAVVGMVDAVGGIDVTTEVTINDPLYPDMNFGYDPFYLSAGTHHLDGRTALKYARTRHGDSDIQRAERQQQVLFSIRDKILDLNMIPQLIIQAPTLLSSLEENVHTSLDLGRMIQLAWYLKDIPDENIKTGVIDYRYLQNYQTPDGQQVLIVNNYMLGQLMIEVFGANYSQ